MTRQTNDNTRFTTPKRVRMSPVAKGSCPGTPRKNSDTPKAPRRLDGSYAVRRVGGIPSTFPTME